jgi:hemerythrin
MAVSTWNYSYSVKVAACDNQHMKLFEIMDRLAAAMRMGKGQDIVGETLNELLEYTRTHFRDEEVLMEKANYSGLVAHKQMHQTFENKVQNLQKLSLTGKRANAMQVLSLIRAWLVDHIQKADKQYSAQMNAAGIY